MKNRAEIVEYLAKKVVGAYLSGSDHVFYQVPMEFAAFILKMEEKDLYKEVKADAFKMVEEEWARQRLKEQKG